MILMTEYNDQNLLPEDFTPSEMDVICGWARQNYHHAGNQMLRDMIQENVPKYNAAKSKTDKGKVIMTIVEKIQRESPTGVGLVKQNAKTGRWSFIGTEKAKDKIGHALRKATQEGARQRSKQKIMMLKSKRQISTTLQDHHHHHHLGGSTADPSPAAAPGSPSTGAPGSPSKTVSYDEGGGSKPTSTLGSSKSSSGSSSATAYPGYPRPGELPPPHPYALYPLPSAHYPYPPPPIPPPPPYPGYAYAAAYPGYYPPPPPHVVPATTYDGHPHDSHQAVAPAAAQVMHVHEQQQQPQQTIQHHDEAAVTAHDTHHHDGHHDLVDIHHHLHPQQQQQHEVHHGVEPHPFFHSPE